jgi:hypothetical protein
MPRLWPTFVRHAERFSHEFVVETATGIPSGVGLAKLDVAILRDP